MCEETSRKVSYSQHYSIEVRRPQPKQEERLARRSREDRKIASEKGPVALSQPADARVVVVVVD